MIKRISALNTLAKCPAFAAIDTLTDRSSGKAADTGTAVGRAIQLWHEGGEHAQALESALLQCERETADHPLADFDLVAKWATGYAGDSRNVGVVEAGSCEKEVTFQLGDHVLVGHIDQLRRVHGALSVWDVKSGKGGGREMSHVHAWQLSAYALACTATLGETVLPGGIIRVRGYAHNNRCKWDKDDLTTAPVFFYMPWDLAMCATMMGSVKHHLDLLAAGDVLQHPGQQCLYCPGEGPNNCGDRLADAFEESV